MSVVCAENSNRLVEAEGLTNKLTQQHHHPGNRNPGQQQEEEAEECPLAPHFLRPLSPTLPPFSPPSPSSSMGDSDTGGGEEYGDGRSDPATPPSDSEDMVALGQLDHQGAENPFSRFAHPSPPSLQPHPSACHSRHHYGITTHQHHHGSLDAQHALLYATTAVQPPGAIHAKPPTGQNRFAATRRSPCSHVPAASQPLARNTTESKVPPPLLCSQGPPEESSSSVGVAPQRSGGCVSPACVKQEESSRWGETCAGCGRVILDRFYLMAVERRWHASCLQCARCWRVLDGDATCYSRDGRIYCKRDYYILFGGKRCARCHDTITASELVMRARDLVFHLRCFTCFACGTALSKGDHFAIRHSSVFCRLHFALSNLEQHGNSRRTVGGGSSTEDTEAGDLVRPPTISPADDVPPHHRQHSPPPTEPGPFPTGRPCPDGRLRFHGTPSPPEGPHVPAPIPTEAPLHQQHQGGAVEGTPGVDVHMFNGGAVSRQKGRPRKRKPKDLESMTASLDLNTDSYLDVGYVGRGPEALSPGPAMGHQLGGSQQQRTKRMRTSFKHHQLRTMKSYFAINHNPDAKDLKQLSQKTGLPKRVLQVWFQNARAKWRRMMVKQDASKCSPPGDKNPMLLAPPLHSHSAPSSPHFAPGGHPIPPHSPSSSLSATGTHDDADSQRQRFLSSSSAECP